VNSALAATTTSVADRRKAKPFRRHPGPEGRDRCRPQVTRRLACELGFRCGAPGFSKGRGRGLSGGKEQTGARFSDLS